MSAVTYDNSPVTVIFDGENWVGLSEKVGTGNTYTSPLMATRQEAENYGLRLKMVYDACAEAGLVVTDEVRDARAKKLCRRILDGATVGRREQFRENVGEARYQELVERGII